MKNKKSILTGSLLTGALLAIGGIDANATSSFNFNHLGSGAEVRSSLLERALSSNRFIELTCASNSGSKEEPKANTDAKAKDGKCGEGKCGEGKCGEKKTDKKNDKDAKAKPAAKDAKAKDGKCGEGKCGDKKDPK